VSVNEKEVLVGGQAVIEGVMMRAPGAIATAVRKPDGTIAIKRESFVPLGERSRLYKLPVLRGAAGLLEMLAVGIRALNYSAQMALADETSKGEKPFSNFQLVVMLVVSLSVALALFFVAPLAAATALFNFDQNPLAFNAVAGGIRLLVFFTYLFSISRMKDIRRVFEYHGAEHKVVFAHERGAGLTPEAAARQTRFHPRCGTSFLLVVMMSSIVFFALLDGTVIAIAGKLTLPMRLMTHLPLIPLVGGISYEFIRFSARHSESTLGRLVVAPGLWLQRITTQEPDTAQLEVAVAALRAALEPAVQPEVFDSPRAVAAG